MIDWRMMILGFAVALIAIAPAGNAAGTDETAAEGKWRLVVDFTEDNLAGMAEFAPDKQLRDDLMRLAGARKYYAGEDQCKSIDDPTAIFLGGGQVEGRFLPNGEQLLIHYLTRSCNEGYHWTTGHLALFQDGKIVANLSPECATGIDAIVDTVGSNLQRVVTGCGFSRQGYTTMRAKILGYRNGKFQLVHDVGTVYSDDCGVAEAGTETVAVVYERKSNGEVRSKNYARSCDSQGKKIKDYRFLYNGPMRE